MDIAAIYEEMTDGERCHMANKLYKEGFVAIKAQKELDTLQREFDIVDSACSFWKDTAIDLGYEE